MTEVIKLVNNMCRGTCQNWKSIFVDFAQPSLLCHAFVMFTTLPVSFCRSDMYLLGNAVVIFSVVKLNTKRIKELQNQHSRQAVELLSLA